jgi:hypothetical protein
MIEIAKVAFQSLRLRLLAEHPHSIEDSACWQLFAGQSTSWLSSMLFSCNFSIASLTVASSGCWLLNAT